MRLQRRHIWPLITICLLMVTSAAFSELFDPPAVYLTWERDPQSTITIQWITLDNRPDDTVEYRPVNEAQWATAKGSHQPMPGRNPYFIHRVTLTQLQPDTPYAFRTGSDAVTFKFQTMPKSLSSPIRFVVGGDVYHDGIEIVEEMNSQAAKTNPRFAIVGGDLAYSNGRSNFWARWGFIREKMDRWLVWLKSWKKTMITPEGFLIPMLPLIGNHDVHCGYKQTPKEAKFFYALFSMPGSQGYNVLDFDRYLSIWLLDSDHTHPVSGEQTRWLSNTLVERQDVLHKFAAYHLSAYPSVRPFSDPISQEIRKNWVPLFERYGLNSAFEHHDHAYKRTHPLRNGVVDPTGVLYIGNGAWGVAKPRTPYTPQESWYLARSAAVRHVIVVTLEGTHRQFTAIDSKGNIIDEWKQ